MVGIFQVGMKIPGPVFSLKERRKYANSLKDNLKNRFNISLREVPDDKILNSIEFTIAYVALDSGEIEKFQSSLYSILGESTLETLYVNREVI
ncbi:DUF503 family protein [Candidatus Calescamantes bacterium]|nr:DUF503 family protein [Candidatus Calescamantes bacterium]MCK5599905.1 DUF503 family protein [bacterium]